MFFLLAASSLTLAACQSPSVGSAAEGPSGSKSAGDSAKNISRLERQLQVATDRANLARAQEHEQGGANAHSVARAESELKDLEDQLAELERVSMPARVASARLDLSMARDALSEQEEELAQLEMMYKESDLADKTREIVLNRGKRRVERAKERLENQTRDEQALEQTILPHEHDRLARQIELKRHDLERAHRDGEMQQQEKHIAVAAADMEVMRAEAELAAAREGSTK
jgi:hypothetical protein